MVVKILGIELEANLLNPDVADIYEAELKNVARKSNESKECESMAAGIRMQCQAVIDCIEHIFGEGSSKKVFGKSVDLIRCVEAFRDVTSMYDTQVNPQMEAIIGQYLPDQLK